MRRWLKSACTHTEIRTAGLRTRDWGPKLLVSLPPDAILLPDAREWDLENTYRKVKETLFVTGSP
jgi:hypothetical protein